MFTPFVLSLLLATAVKAYAPKCVVNSKENEIGGELICEVNKLAVRSLRDAPVQFSLESSCSTRTESVLEIRLNNKHLIDVKRLPALSGHIWALGYEDKLIAVDDPKIKIKTDSDLFVVHSADNRVTQRGVLQRIVPTPARRELLLFSFRVSDSKCPIKVLFDPEFFELSGASRNIHSNLLTLDVLAIYFAVALAAALLLVIVIAVPTFFFGHSNTKSTTTVSERSCDSIA